MELNDIGGLLTQFNIGTSTAENDPLLEVARIETQEFNDLYFSDRIDLVRGTKGSGKTALYRVLYFLERWARERHKIIMAFGVEPEGDPLFKRYSQQFDAFSEEDFERFWHGYFIYLSILALQERKSDLTADAQAEVDRVIDGFAPELKAVLGKSLSISDRIAGWLKHHQTSRIDKFEAGIKAAAGPTGDASIEPKVSVQLKEGEKSKESLDIGTAIRDQLIGLTRTATFRVWILLDRLDEVFLRRSESEARGLRALLRAAYRFSNPQIRVKLFLREDIFETLASSGFTALTHVADRCSGVMSWSHRELLHLVTKRLAAMPSITTYFKFDQTRVDGNPTYQKEIFYTIFPRKIGKQETFEWLLGVLRDGKNQVTPRDLIDLLNHARNRQLRTFQAERKDQKHLIEEAALKEGLCDLSIDKKDKYLIAEFPHLRADILAFQGGHSDYSAAALEQKLGQNWRAKAENLRSIGFLRYDSKRPSWNVPVIWRKGLDIRRGAVET